MQAQGFQAGYDVACFPQKIVARPDGGFFLVGQFCINMPVVRLNAEGGVEWCEKIDGGFNDFDPYAACLMSNGDLLIGGQTDYWNEYHGKGLLMRLSGGTGEVIWSRTFDPGYDMYIREVIETPGGDILVGGYLSDQGNYNGYLATVYPDGTLQEIRQNNMTGVVELATNTDGRCVAKSGEQVGVFDNGEMTAYAVESIPGMLAPCHTSVSMLPDGGYYILATAAFGINQQHRLHLTKVAPDLTYSWHAQYSGPSFECGVDMRATADGGCVIAGNTEDMYGINHRTFLIKVGPSGQIEWSYGYDAMADPCSLTLCPDGGFAVYGRTPDFMSVLRTDSLGYNGCDRSTMEWDTTSQTGSGSMGPGSSTAAITVIQEDAQPLFITNYEVPVTMYCGMDLSDPVTISVDPPVPNVISPNGDGHNDGLSLVSKAGPMSLRIFDRFGLLMTELHGSVLQWNGSNDRNEPVPEGVYYYELQMPGPDDAPSHRTGYLHVLR